VCERREATRSREGGPSKGTRLDTREGRARWLEEEEEVVVVVVWLLSVIMLPPLSCLSLVPANQRPLCAVSGVGSGSGM
jgi:hypothetical protein